MLINLKIILGRLRLGYNSSPPHRRSGLHTYDLSPQTRHFLLNREAHSVSEALLGYRFLTCFQKSVNCNIEHAFDTSTLARKELALSKSNVELHQARFIDRA